MADRQTKHIILGHALELCGQLAGWWNGGSLTEGVNELWPNTEWRAFGVVGGLHAHADKYWRWMGVDWQCCSDWGGQHDHSTSHFHIMQKVVDR